MIELICRAQRGEIRAVAAIVEQLGVRIERMALYYGRRCGEDAGDLAQEAWIGVLNALAETDVAIGDPAQFLLKHARWRLLDFIRWNRRRRHDSLEETLPEYSPPVQASALESLWIRQFAASLTETQQAVLCRLLAGDTWREAAASLGCTSANIAYHVRQIRRAYAEFGGMVG